MLSEVYNKYKKTVLNLIDSGDYKNKMKLVDSTITIDKPADDYFEGYPKSIALNSLKHADLKILGSDGVFHSDLSNEFYASSFTNNNICMMTALPYKDGTALTNFNYYVYNSYGLDELHHLNYDLTGNSTKLHDGLIIKHWVNFFKDCGSSFEQGYLLCLEKVDDDGIVVCPPSCEGIVFLNDTVEKQVKRILMFSTSVLKLVFLKSTTHLTASEFRANGAILADMFGKKLEIYQDNSFDINNTLFNDNKLGFTYYTGDVDDLFVHSLSDTPSIKFESLTDTREEIGCTLFGSKIFVFSGYIRHTSCKLNFKTETGEQVEEVTLSSPSTNLVLAGNVKNLILTDGRIGNICTYEFFDSILCGNLTVEKITLHLQELLIGDNTAFYSVVGFQQSNYIPVLVLLHNLKRLQQELAVEVNLIYCDSMVTIDELRGFILFSLFLGSCIGEQADSILDRYTEEDAMETKRVLENKFGSIQTSIGAMGLNQAIEMFCSGSNVKITGYNESLLRLEMCTESGVELHCNFVEFIILRSFGLYTTQCVNKKKGKYDYSTTDTYLSEKSSYTKQYSFLLHFIDKKDGEVYLGCKEVNLCQVKKGLDSLCTEYFHLHGDKGRRDDYRGNKRVLQKNGCSVNLSPAHVTKKALETIKESIKKEDFRYSNLKEIAGYIKHSVSCGLTGGVQVECLGCKSISISNIQTTIVMDKLYYNSYYTFYFIKLGEEEYQIEEQCLKKLLCSGSIVCASLYGNIADKGVIWAKTDYDKSFIEGIENLITTSRLFYGDTIEDTVKVTYYPGLDGKYTLGIYGIEEIELPSFATSAYPLSIHLLTTKILEKGLNIEIQKLKHIIVTKDYDFSDMSVLLCDNDKDIEIEFEEDVVYTGKCLEVKYLITNGTVKLPQNFEVFYTYKQIKEGNSSDYILTCADDIHYEIYVRKGSTVRRATIAAFMDIADGCTVVNGALEGPVLKELVLHGGTYATNVFKNSTSLEKVTVDGGHVVFSLQAFINCSKLTSVECINGGTFEILGLEQSYLLGAYTVETLSPYMYNRLLEESLVDDTGLGTDVDTDVGTILDVIPYSLDADGYCTFRVRGKENIILTLKEAYTLYSQGVLNLRHTDKAGNEINFVKTINAVDCLVFHPSTSAKLCSIAFYIVFDRNSFDDKEDAIRLVKTPVIMVLDINDIYHGRVTDLPYFLFGKGNRVGVYITGNRSGDALVFNFYQNMPYFSTTYALWMKYAEGIYSTKPEATDYRLDIFNNLYLPASHEIDWDGNLLHSNGKGSNCILVGGKYKYARYFSTLSQTPTTGNLILTPGIGENCLLKFYPMTIKVPKYANVNTFWSNLTALYIQTESFFDRRATVVSFNTTGEEITKYHTFLVDVVSDTEMYLDSLPLFHFTAHREAKILIHCDISIDTFMIYLHSCTHNYTEGDKKLLCLNLQGESSLYVTDLGTKLFTELIISGYASLAYQLYMHSTEDRKEELSKLGEYTLLKNWYDTGDISNKALELHTIADKPVIKAKKYTNSGVDEYLLGEGWAEPVKTIEEELADIKVEVDIEVVDNSLTSAEREDFHTDVNNKKDEIYEETDEDETDLDLVAEQGKGVEDTNTDSGENTLEILAETLGVNLNTGKEEILSDYNRKQEKKTSKKAELEAEEEKEALLQQEALLETAEKELGEDLKSIYTYTDEDLEDTQKKTQRQTKKKYAKRFKEEKNKQKSIPQVEDKEMESLEVLLSDNVLADNLKDRIHTGYYKENGLASGLMGTLMKKRVQSLEEKLISLEKKEKKQKESLTVVAEVYRETMLVGYSVRQDTTGLLKKLSVSSVKNLLTANKYEVMGVSLIDGVIVATSILSIEEM